MYFVSRRIDFSAMHVFRREELTEEENARLFGPYSSPNGHGHDYRLYVTVKGMMNEQTGMVVNITDIDAVVKELVSRHLDGKYLNRENPYFHDRIPTTENLVTYIWEQLEHRMPQSKLHKVRLEEDPFLFSEKEDGTLVQLSRKYHFSSAHRLHSPHLSDEENLRIFGKCNNPNGHGHNYYLVVTVEGPIDPLTGMIIPIPELDEIVEREVLRKFDHKHLNLDTEEFADLNPTSEALAMVIFKLLKPHLPALKKIGIWETEKNYFEYIGA